MNKKKLLGIFSGKWKSIISAVLVCALIAGALGAVMAIAGNETKKISNLAFERGRLDENGIFVEDNTAIFTEDMFECIGLHIETNVKFNHEYQIFYYNFDGVFLECSEKYTVTSRLDIPELAKYARVVVYTDEEISFYQVNSIARTLDIKVSKKQNFALHNHFMIDESNPDRVVTYNVVDGGVNYSTCLEWYGEDSELNVLATGWSPVLPVDVTGWEKVFLKFENASDSNELIYFFTRIVDEKETIVPANTPHKRLNGGTVEFVLEVPDGAEIFHANTRTEKSHHYSIYQYK